MKGKTWSVKEFRTPVSWSAFKYIGNKFRRPQSCQKTRELYRTEVSLTANLKSCKMWKLYMIYRTGCPCRKCSFQLPSLSCTAAAIIFSPFLKSCSCQFYSISASLGRRTVERGEGGSPIPIQLPLPPSPPLQRSYRWDMSSSCQLWNAFIFKNHHIETVHRCLRVGRRRWDWARICKPLKESRNRFLAWRNRFLGTDT